MFKTIEEGYKFYSNACKCYTVWINECKSTKLKRFLYHFNSTKLQQNDAFKNQLYAMERVLGLSEKEKML